MKKKLSVAIAIISIVNLLFVFVACDNNNGNTTPSGQPSGEIASGSISSGDLSSGEINSGEVGSGEIDSGEEYIYPEGTLVINSAYQPPQIDDSGVNYNDAFIIDGTTITGLTPYGKTLQKLVVPDGITAIGDNAFAFGIEDPDEMFDSVLKAIELPNSVTSIGDQAFAGNLQLIWIGISDNLQSIGNETFLYCKSLVELELPDSITSIGEGAFFYCVNMVIKCKSQQIISQMSDKFQILFEPGWEIPVICDYQSGVANDGYIYVVGSDGVQYALKDGEAKVSGHAYIEGEIKLPKNIGYKGEIFNLTSIGYGAFYLSKLESLIIPIGVKSIDAYAFEGCISLTSVTIPNSVTSIGYATFIRCYSLVSISIPRSVTVIGDHAFESCSSLTSITIPSSVTNIGDSAFYDCIKLSIYCEVNSKPSGWDKNWNCDNRPVVWGYSGN